MKLRLWLLKMRGMKIGKRTWIDREARLDSLYPGLISIGSDCVVCSGAYVLAHDSSFKDKKPQPTRIGDRCFIGVNSVVLPGVSIGDGSVIGAGTVVVHDLQAGSVVAGNPARLLYLRPEAPVEPDQP